jgi:hypothetical protein
MTDDALAPFIRAYRDENSGASLDARAIRRRLLAGVGRGVQRRLLVVRYVLPVAATFFGSVALAASHGALPRFDEVRAWFGATEAETPATAPAGVRRSKGRAHVPPAIRPSAPAPEPVPAVALEDLDAQAVPPSLGLRASPDPLRADLTAYEEAHRRHFHASDASRALSGWDSYLASHPGGTFAPEAHLNRAVCLLRLGRRSEARAALERLARAPSGAYARDRARALLDALE